MASRSRSRSRSHSLGEAEGPHEAIVLRTNHEAIRISCDLTRTRVRHIKAILQSKHDIQEPQLMTVAVKQLRYANQKCVFKLLDDNDADETYDLHIEIIDDERSETVIEVKSSNTIGYVKAELLSKVAVNDPQLLLPKPRLHPSDDVSLSMLGSPRKLFGISQGWFQNTCWGDDE